MSEPMCLQCEIKKRTPCRTNGRFDPARLAEALLTHFRETQGQEQTSDTYRSEHRLGWSFSCDFDLARSYPNLVIDTRLAYLALEPYRREVAFMAAGSIETAVRKHGPWIIAGIEVEAERSARFRYMLSGIWGERDADPDVWARIQAAIAEGPHMDDDPRTPQGSMRRRRDV